jgi:hypothetical protein
MRRIFTRSVGGIKRGSIVPPTDQYKDWDGFRENLRIHHNVTDPIESYSMLVDEAAQKYVASLPPEDEDVAPVIGKPTREAHARADARPR